MARLPRLTTQAFRLLKPTTPYYVQTRTFLPGGMANIEEILKAFPPPERLTDLQDPNQNGGYINPPAIKRQFRDPYAKWDDQQERRNFGEPVHEDNDLLGMFSTYEYTWTTPWNAVFQLSCAVSCFVGMYFLCSFLYPEQIAYPREFPNDGLRRELGGSGGMRARKAGDPEPEI